jgi:dTDP-4-amino-4,6-dideoxygalactose transaminase
VTPLGALGARLEERLKSHSATVGVVGLGYVGLPLGLPEERRPAHHIYHQYTVRSAKREALAAALAGLGVGTSVHYPSTIPAQPVFSQPNADRDFPVATQAAAEVLCLPCFPELLDPEVDQVVDAIKRALAQVV